MFLLAIALVGCGGAKEESPKTLDELTLGALQEFDGDAGPENVAGLHDWLLDNEPAWPVEAGGYMLDSITADDVDTMEHSDDVDWTQVYGVGVPLRVDGTMGMYTEVATEADQSFADDTYIKWDRTILEGSAEGLASGASIHTDNDIDKAGPFGVDIPYHAFKDYKWFGDVLAARTWVPEEGWGEDGNNGIICGFTIELWFADGDSIVWYNGQWTQIASIVSGFGSPEFWADQFIQGTIDYMEGTEAHVLGEDTGE